MEPDKADVGGVTDDEEEDVGGLGDGKRRFSVSGSEIYEGLGLRWSSIEDGEGVAGGDEMPSHGAAHDSGADPADASGLRRYGSSLRRCRRHGEAAVEREDELGSPKRTKDAMKARKHQLKDSQWHIGNISVFH